MQRVASKSAGVGGLGWFVAVVFVILATFAAVAVYGEWRGNLAQNEVSGWSRTEAVIESAEVRKQRSIGRGSSLFSEYEVIDLQYQYRVGEIPYRGLRFRMDLRGVGYDRAEAEARFAIGKRVEIAYDPRRYERSVFDPSPPVWWVAWAYAAAAMVFVISAVVQILGWSRSKDVVASWATRAFEPAFRRIRTRHEEQSRRARLRPKRQRRPR